MYLIMSTECKIGYARVSTDDQDMALQVNALIAAGVPAAHIYSEHASGGTTKRKALEKVLVDMRKGDTIYIWKLDRLGRSLRDLIDMVDLIQERGVSLVSLTDGLDTTTPGGRFFFHIMGAVAQFERDIASERTKAGMAARKAAGAKFGKPSAIAGNPRRLAAMQPLYDSGDLQTMMARDALPLLNAADPKAAKIKSLETFNRWRRDGFPGLAGAAD